jgi:peroxiredoxin
MYDRIWTSLLGGLALAGAVLVVVLALRVSALDDEVRRLRFERNLPQVGDVAPPLHAALLDGDSIELGRPGGGRRQIWFVFNTTCSICRASLTGWKAVYANVADDASAQVLGISLDSLEPTRRYVGEQDLPFPVALLDDPVGAALYRIPGVPLTMVLDDVGRILLVRSGLFPRVAAESLAAAVRANGKPGADPAVRP